MADILGAGGTSLGGLTATGAGSVLHWDVTLGEPAWGEVVQLLAPTLTFTVTTRHGATSRAQVQVATDPDFTSMAWSTTVLDVPDTIETGVQASGLPDMTVFFWRVRAGDGTSWGLWAPTQSFMVNTHVGDAVEYVYVNQGVEITLDDAGIEYVYLNQGIQITLDSDAVEYAYLGDVNQATPHPHVWFLRPSRGVAGDGIAVYGFGFGDLPATYNGRLEYKDPTTGQWTTLPVTSWSTKLPGPNAYNAARLIDPDAGVVTTQHTVVEFSIPPGALPPGALVRVVTNGA